MATDTSRNPFFQGSFISTRIFVYLTLVITFFFYERFCTLVITGKAFNLVKCFQTIQPFHIPEITNYLGIACFTVRKKDENGVWRNANEINQAKKRA